MVCEVALFGVPDKQKKKAPFSMGKSADEKHGGNRVTGCCLEVSDAQLDRVTKNS